MATTSCNECTGTGQVRAFDGDWQARQAAGETDPCPWCSGSGQVEISYVVTGHGHNGDHTFSEVWDVVPTLKLARQAAQVAMANRFEHTLADGRPTLRWVEITGPGIEESIGLEPNAAGELVWDGEDDEKVQWRISKAEGEAVAAMLAPLPVGAEFRLAGAGSAYSATYRKNAAGLWDQISAPCSPLVINMAADHLGFCVGAAAVRKALAGAQVAS